MPKPVVTLLLSRRLDDPKSGNSQYLQHFIKLIRQNDVFLRIVMAPRRSFGNLPWMAVDETLAKSVDEIVWPGTAQVAGKYVSLAPSVWVAFAKRLVFLAVNAAKGQANKRPFSLLGKQMDKSEEIALARAANITNSDVVIAEYSSLGSVLSMTDAPRKGIFLHDLFSLRAKSFRAMGRTPDHYEITVEDEMVRCGHANVLFHASRSELEVLEQTMPDTKHLWVRPEVKMPDPSEIATARADADNPARAVFVGVRHGGNLDALTHLLEDIWPKVREKKPDALLWIVGSICEDVPDQYKEGHGIKLCGRVESLGSIGGADSVGLAPTRIASGVSIKVAEYLSLAMPTVTLPTSLHGFGSALSDLVVQGDDAEGFASEVVTLLDDSEQRTRLSEAATKSIHSRLTNEEIVKFFSNLR